MVTRPVFNQGFTLLELLVVLVIAGLLTSLAAPVISTVVPGVRLRTEVDEVASTLRQARMQALRIGSDVDVVFLPDDAGYRGPDGALRLLGEGVRLIVTGSAGFEIAGTKASETPLRFFPDGSSNGGVIDIAGSGQRYWIAVDWLMGRVEVGRHEG